MVTVPVTVDGNTRAGAWFRGGIVGAGLRGQVPGGFSRAGMGRAGALCFRCLLGGCAVLTLDLEARASWPAANSLNLSLRPSLELGPGVGTAGVPEPGLMGRRRSRSLPRA